MHRHGHDTPNKSLSAGGCGFSTRIALSDSRSRATRATLPSRIKIVIVVYRACVCSRKSVRNEHYNAVCISSRLSLKDPRPFTSKLPYSRSRAAAVIRPFRAYTLHPTRIGCAINERRSTRGGGTRVSAACVTRVRACARCDARAPERARETDVYTHRRGVP